MWRQWGSDSQQVQEHHYSDNEASDGIAVLASDRKESVIFIAENVSGSIQGPWIIARASQGLLTFSTFSSDMSSLLGMIYNL